MGSLKRKEGPNGSSVAKALIPSSDSRPPKRTKSDKANKLLDGDHVGAGRDSGKGEKHGKGSDSRTPAVSLLREEEPMFPRGGGSVLTPLEQKQIQAQANLDVLFEHDAAGAQGKKASRAPKPNKRKSSHNAESSQGSKAARDTDAVRIESLNFKRLVKGAVVLGTIHVIKPLELVIALPNNIMGHVPITAISDSLTAQLQADMAAKGGEGDGEGKVEGEEEDDDNGSDVDLKSLLRIGQYVRAYVVSTIDESASAVPGKTKRRIGLSLQPAHANSGLTEQGVVENCTLMASIASAEDHGFVMDLDLPESKMRGFLPNKQVDPACPPETLQPGSVFLCTVIGKKARGNVVQLSTLPERLANPKHCPSDATTIDTFQPGTVADVLISEVRLRGLVGKVMGHLDVTADLVHSGAGPDDVDLEEKYQVGSRVRARVICTFPAADNPKLGVSVLPHVLALGPKMATQDGKQLLPWEVMPSSARVPECKIKKVEPDIGLYVDIGIEGVAGFVHISRVKDGKVDTLFEESGPHKIGTVHPGRVIGYNAFDGMFLLSLEQSILDQLYLRIEDIPVGDVVPGLVERLVVNENGVSGLIVKIAEGISGLVPEMHMADVHLQNPEKKFREGMKVKARVLSTNPDRHQLRLTLKKTLVNSDCEVINNYTDLQVGMASPGTIVKVLPTGAIVQFYGQVRGFLPVSEMSEAYIRDPLEHFRLGQVCMCHVLSFDPDDSRLIVSCKDPAAFGIDKQIALRDLKVRDVVSAKVTQKTEDDIFVELLDSSLRAILPVSQLTDKSAKQTQSALKKIYVGQTLSNLVVLEKNDKRRSIILSRKPSLVTAAKEGKLLSSYDDAQVKQKVPGFIRNVTATAAFVEFAGKVVALLPRSHIPLDQQQHDGFGMRKGQSVVVKITSVDRENRRIIVAIPSAADEELVKTAKVVDKALGSLDASITSVDDLNVGKITRVRVASVKNTQLNVRIADNIHGHVHVSQVFERWEDIPNPKHPLDHFRPREVIRVRVLGVHDARKHRFLPITSRSSHAVLELSAKPSDLRQDSPPALLSFDNIQAGSTHLGFVNNVSRGHLWVSLSANVRGRISIMEASDDLSGLKDLEKNFPIGSAIRARVLSVNAESQQLELSARSEGSARDLDWENIEEGLVVPGRVTKVNERQVMVQLSETLAGPVHLADIADDYDEAITLGYSKNEIVRVAVVETDKSNKRIRLSLRPSKVMNSSLPVMDKEITKKTKLQVGDILRGFVKNVSDKGLFVSLGGDVTAMVQIKNLADGFLKEWKDGFQVDQVVKGRIISLAEGRMQMSLKPSVLEKEFVPLIALEDLKEGQVVTGKIRRVEDYGAFIEVDGSANVSGLCHRSEMADRPVKDPKALYKAGDLVKALVLKVDPKQRRVNFGLKPSYFDGTENDDGMDVDGEDDEAPSQPDSDEDEDVEDIIEDVGSVVITGTDNVGDDDSSDTDTDEGSEDDVDMSEAPTAGPGGLDAGGFNWSGNVLDAGDGERAIGKKSGASLALSTSKEARKDQRGGAPRIQEDRTAQLDAHGPQDAGDYNRLLLSQPDSSKLWIAYMAFQMQAGDLEGARAVAERAIKTINMHEEREKLQVWVAYLNLEHAFGTDEGLEEVFRRACTYNDEESVYERLTTIYIQSGKNDKARALFETMVKKFGSRSVDLWYNYAQFLHTTAGCADEARKLLPRARKSLGPSRETQLALVRRWAALEFRSPNGDRDQGRALFENLIVAFPKSLDLWTQLLKLEMRTGTTSAHNHEKDGDSSGRNNKAAPAASPAVADPAVIRDVFERGAKAEGLKRRHGAQWFQWWAEWEGEHGDAKSRERVAARRREWERAVEARRKKASGTGGD